MSSQKSMKKLETIAKELEQITSNEKESVRIIKEFKDSYSFNILDEIISDYLLGNGFVQVTSLPWKQDMLGIRNTDIKNNPFYVKEGYAFKINSYQGHYVLASFVDTSNKRDVWDCMEGIKNVHFSVYEMASDYVTWEYPVIALSFMAGFAGTMLYTLVNSGIPPQKPWGLFELGLMTFGGTVCSVGGIAIAKKYSNSKIKIPNKVGYNPIAVGGYEVIPKLIETLDKEDIGHKQTKTKRKKPYHQSLR